MAAPSIDVRNSGGFTPNDIVFLQQKCETLGYLPRIYSHVTEALEHLAPSVVCIDGPFDQHASMSLAALERDAHVFAEKPCALSLDELAHT